ncbi:MAG TPA: 3-hydroxyacyl-CoA dehydrogenase NAD-binding domain-containing protein [Anaeromyxobacter sp.]
MMQIDTVAVVGATDEGTICALVAALAGCAVRVYDGSVAALERAFEVVRRRVELGCAAGAITRTERQRILDGLLFTPDLDEALTGADLAVDATSAPVEDVYDHLASALRATAAVAAAGATAAEEIASALPQPARVLGLALSEAHGPVPRLEMIAARGTSDHVLERARAFAARVNRASRTGPRMDPAGSA